MPLAVDTELYRRIYETRSERAERKIRDGHCACGKIIPDGVSALSQPLSAYQRGRLEGIIAAQLKVYGGYLIPDLVTDELLAELNDSYVKASGGKVSISRRELVFACLRDNGKRAVSCLRTAVPPLCDGIVVQ